MALEKQKTLEEEYGKRIQKKLNKAMKKTIDKMQRKVIVKSIIDMYKQSIKEFYDHYEPNTYTRNRFLYGAYEVVKKSTINRKTDNRTFTLGIKVDGDRIKNLRDFPTRGSYGYRAEPKWVFDRAYAQGIHGFSDKEPWVKKLDKRREKEFSGNFNYSKGHYTWGMFYRRHTPPIMKPTPRDLMMKKFEQFVTKDLNDLWTETFSYYLEHPRRK